ncbi:hypothetical protein KCU95_g6792, partial [Aureobasidium melanogenum]
MDDPVAEIPYVIALLTETPPSLQLAAVNKYFTPNASFTHPFCRTGSSAYSRYLVERIYRWYKIMSPRITAKVHSVSYDEKNLVLYVGLTQVFAIWAIPTHRAEVSLVTVLHLSPQKDPQNEEKIKYYISSQNDLYQTDQFIKFVLPWISIIVPIWQILATFFCVIGSYLFTPVTWWEEHFQDQFTRAERPPKWADAR